MKLTNKEIYRKRSVIMTPEKAEKIVDTIIITVGSAFLAMVGYFVAILILL